MRAPRSSIAGRLAGGSTLQNAGRRVAKNTNARCVRCYRRRFRAGRWAGGETVGVAARRLVVRSATSRTHRISTPPRSPFDDDQCVRCVGPDDPEHRAADRQSDGAHQEKPDLSIPAHPNACRRSRTPCRRSSRGCSGRRERALRWFRGPTRRKRRRRSPGWRAGAGSGWRGRRRVARRRWRGGRSRRQPSADAHVRRQPAKSWVHHR